MPNFVKICKLVAKILIFLQVFKMATVSHLEFVLGTFGPPTMSTWGSLTLQNLVMIDAVVFTARRYAKRGICRRRVSLSVCLCVVVCVCVCHTPVLYQNG